MLNQKRRPGRPAGSSSEATRAKILAAARICFAHTGFGLTTNRDIAERADITPAAIYQYFDSKLALYAAVSREAISKVAAHMGDRAAVDATLGGGLSSVILGLVELHGRDPTLAPFLNALPTEFQRHPELAGAIDDAPQTINEITQKIVTRGVAGGDLPAEDAPRTAAMFVACLMGLSQFAVLFGAEAGAVAANAFADLLQGRLLPQPPTAAVAPKRRPATRSPKRTKPRR
ncbi:MAG: TetR/AcrR family transcriptional regulator [Polyangiales bacterium]